MKFRFAFNCPPFRSAFVTFFFVIFFLLYFICCFLLFLKFYVLSHSLPTFYPVFLYVTLSLAIIKFCFNFFLPLCSWVNSVLFSFHFFYPFDVISANFWLWLLCFLSLLLTFVFTKFPLFFSRGYFWILRNLVYDREL